MTARLSEKAAGARITRTVVLYLALALIGLVGTWYFNLTYTGGDYLGDWFANRASSSAAIDILVTFLVCAVLYVRESRRLGWRAWVPVLFIVLSLTVAVAFAFPLFLAAREAARPRRAVEPEPSDRPLPARSTPSGKADR